MLLTREQVKKLLMQRNVCANEACDKCGKVLGELRFTSRARPGEFCSRECRGGENILTPGKCRGCGASLAGKRKGSIWCNDTCMHRTQHKPRKLHFRPGQQHTIPAYAHTSLPG